MSNKLPVEVKNDNIFKRFFNYIKRIFKKKTSMETIEKSEESTIVKNKSKITELYKLENFDEVNADVIKEANKKHKIEEIIRIIEKKTRNIKKFGYTQIRSNRPIL